jgi:hypothetical protein
MIRIGQWSLFQYEERSHHISSSICTLNNCNKFEIITMLSVTVFIFHRKYKLGSVSLPPTPKLIPSLVHIPIVLRWYSIVFFIQLSPFCKVVCYGNLFKVCCTFRIQPTRFCKSENVPMTPQESFRPFDACDLASQLICNRAEILGREWGGT